MTMLGFNSGAPSFAQPPQPFASDDAIHQAFGQSHGGYDDGGGGGFDSEFQPTAVLVTDYRSEVPEDEGEVRSAEMHWWRAAEHSCAGISVELSSGGGCDWFCGSANSF